MQFILQIFVNVEQRDRKRTLCSRLPAISATNDEALTFASRSPTARLFLTIYDLVMSNVNNRTKC